MNTHRRCWCAVALACALATAFSTRALADALRFAAVTFDGRFTHIDPAAGEVAPTRSDLPTRLNAIARAPTGEYMVGRAHSLADPTWTQEFYWLNPLTGDTQPALSLSFGSNQAVRGMAFEPGGALLVTTAGTTGTQLLHRVDVALQSFVTLGPLSGARDAAQGLAFSPAGELFGIVPTSPTNGIAQLLRVNPANGVTTLVGATGTTASQGLDFAPDGRLFAIGFNILAELNPATGQPIGATRPLTGDYRGIEWVPEPGTAALAALAGAALALSRGRRRA